jgi:hypothetical protein
MQLADACQSVVEGAAWGFMNLPESMGLCVFFLVPAGTAYTQAQTEIYLYVDFIKGLMI